MATMTSSSIPPRKALLAGLLFLGAAICALSPALFAPRLFSSYYDWRYFETLAEISRRTVLFFHQAPLWNPYSCGGEVDLANPQSMAAAPSFLLILAFGTALGSKLSLLLYTFLAMDGTYRLSRRLGVGQQGAIVAALSYGLSGYLALHLSIGHINFAGVALYPYLLLFYERSLDQIEWVIPLGAVAAFIAALGGTFTPPMAGELLFFYATMLCIERRSLRPYAPLLYGALLALLFGAVRLFPTLEFILDHPRPTFRREPDFTWPWNLLGDLIAWRDFGPLHGRKYWSHEYSAKLPYVIWPLLLLTVQRRRPLSRRLWVLAGLFALITMGNFLKIAPWSLLQKLPVLRDLRVPSRHVVLVTLMLALLAGLGWDRGLAFLRGRGGDGGILATALGGLIIVLCLADGGIYTALRYRGGFTAHVSVPTQPAPFYFIQGSWQSMREDIFAGHGTLHCDEEAPLQRAEALDPDNVPQERLLDPSAGRVVASAFSPNRRIVEVDLFRETLLLINSNWNEHWKAEPGRVTKVAGRLAVDLAGLPPGRQRITLRYAPRSFAVGAAATALFLPLGALAFFLARRLRRAPRRIDSPSAAGAAVY